VSVEKAEKLFEDIAQSNSVVQMIKRHSIRVMQLSSNLADCVGLNDHNMRIAGLLHDIGKMGVSKNILLKPSRLNDLEFTIMKSHSHIGNMIVRDIFGNATAATYIRDHHERWDGKGYPRGLKGEEITIQGRIINICDAFDTMTRERRIYRNCNYTVDEALEELEKCSGTQFDTNLVNEFIKIIYKQDNEVIQNIIEDIRKNAGNYNTLKPEETSQLRKKNNKN
jgi:putative nucleotidyltransferase with HDIG domain